MGAKMVCGASTETVVIVLVLIVCCVIGIKSYLKKLSSGCYGSGGGAVKKVPVKDRNEAHYPYSARMQVQGMICANCTKRVENALNTMDGVWASADSAKNQVLVRMKVRRTEQELEEAVRGAGYTVISVEFL